MHRRLAVGSWAKAGGEIMIKNIRRPLVFLDISIAEHPPERLIFELHSDLALLPSENFRAMCTGEKGEGGTTLQYKGSYFHRIVKGSMAQGGEILNMSTDESTALLSARLVDSGSNDSSFSIRCGANPDLVRNNEVFGRLLQGHDLLKKIENVGDDEGRPIVDVKIVDCGEIHLSENLAGPASGANLQVLNPFFNQTNWASESSWCDISKRGYDLTTNNTFGVHSNNGNGCVASLVSPPYIATPENQTVLECSGSNSSKAPETGLSVSCKCIKTQCLKRYCECFSTGHFCDSACACKDCRNLKEHEFEVEAAREHVEQRNPHAFGLDESGVRVSSSDKGCNCRKSACGQKYCDCLKALSGCTDRCGCEACANTFGTKQDYIAKMKDYLAKTKAKRHQMLLNGINLPQCNSLNPDLPSPTTPLHFSPHGEYISRLRLPTQEYSNLSSNNQVVLPRDGQNAYPTPYNLQVRINEQNPPPSDSDLEE